MNCIGLDVGSRTIALVEFDQGVRDCAVVATGVNPLERCQRLLAGRKHHRLVATGYGRHLLAGALGCPVVSEIKAYAVGARHLYPDCRTVIDIGGQDSKVTLLREEGGVQKFEMNDRCAAGTGRFLEVMARALELEVGELGEHALRATRGVRLNSLCTVFAETEVVGLISRGEESSAIALGLHEAIAKRIVPMVLRVGARQRVVFAGGCALNPCLVHLLSEELRAQLTVPPNPQTVGALGAALLAAQAGYPPLGAFEAAASSIHQSRSR